jgi:hypothetical protein
MSEHNPAGTTWVCSREEDGVKFLLKSLGSRFVLVAWIKAGLEQE